MSMYDLGLVSTVQGYSGGTSMSKKANSSECTSDCLSIRLSQVVKRREKESASHSPQFITAHW